MALEQGLISVFKHIHEILDAAVVVACVWPRDLTDKQSLESLFT